MHPKKNHRSTPPPHTTSNKQTPPTPSSSEEQGKTTRPVIQNWSLRQDEKRHCGYYFGWSSVPPPTRRKVVVESTSRFRIRFLDPGWPPYPLKQVGFRSRLVVFILWWPGILQLLIGGFYPGKIKMTMRNQSTFESMYLLLKMVIFPLPGSFSGGKDVSFPWSVFFSRDEIPNTFAKKIANRLPSKVIPRHRMNFQSL